LLCLSCYTRLNHPLILSESRAFAPEAASDCRSCHARDAWLAELDPAADPDDNRDHWLLFRGSPWWREAPAALAESGPAPVAPPPAAAPPESSRPLVMGDAPGPRAQQALADSSAAPGGDGEREPRRERHPRKPNRRPVKPAKPAPPDSARQGS
jgi:hypothetical protein